MPRYIDADKLLARYKERLCAGCKKTKNYCEHCCDIPDVISDIEDAPTVDAVESKKGFWEYVDDVDYRCSVCHKYAYGCIGEVMSGQYKYCPYCGAAMEVEEDDDGKEKER